MLRTACLYVSRPAWKGKKFFINGLFRNILAGCATANPVIRSRNFRRFGKITSRTEPMDWEASDERTRRLRPHRQKHAKVLLSFQFSLLVIASEQTNRMWLCGSECKNGLQSQKAINKSRCRPRPNQNHDRPGANFSGNYAGNGKGEIIWRAGCGNHMGKVVLRVDICLAKSLTRSKTGQDRSLLGDIQLVPALTMPVRSTIHWSLCIDNGRQLFICDCLLRNIGKQGLSGYIELTWKSPNLLLVVPFKKSNGTGKTRQFLSLARMVFRKAPVGAPCAQMCRPS